MPKSKHQIPGRVRPAYEFIKAHRDRYSGAVLTDIVHFPARVVVTAVQPFTSGTARNVLEELSGVRKRPMIITHDDPAASSAVLRPPASGSCPTHTEDVT